MCSLPMVVHVWIGKERLLCVHFQWWFMCGLVRRDFCVFTSNGGSCVDW